MAKIKEIGKVVTGKTPSTQNENYWNGNIPFITPTDLLGAAEVKGTERHISEEGLKSIKNNSISGVSVLVGCIGSDMGNVAYTKQTCATNQQINAITDMVKAINPLFIYYYLSNKKALFQQLAGKTTTPILSKSDFEEIEIPIPRKETQDRIVSILSAIDEKIDNNNAICADLEGMAKLLYDYWFVQFDFPDENGKPYKSNGGKMVWNEELKREIPEGWNNGCVSDLGSVVTGGTPSTEHDEYFTADGHAWATPKDLSLLNGRFFFHGATDITEAGLKNSAGNIMPVGSILFTTRAPIGYIAITANPACTNQGFKSIVPHAKYGTEFVFQTMKALIPQMQRVGVGSTFKEVSKDTFSAQPVVLPKEAIVQNYIHRTENIQETLKNLQQENADLVSLRDFLLPMLMNGQVKVKDAG